MPDPSGASDIDSVLNKHRRNLLARWWVWVLVVAVLVVGAGAAVLVKNAMTVREELQAAIPLASELKTKLVTGDVDGAKEAQSRVEANVEASMRVVSEPLWAVGEAFPIVGINFTAVRELVEATDTVVHGAVGPLVDVAASFDPAAFTPVDGSIDTSLLADAAPAIATAHVAVEGALRAVEAIDTSRTLEQVTSAKTQLGGLLEELESPLGALDSIVPLLGPALGTEGPRTYAVMFQNNAEARALGGSALSFAVVGVDSGRIELKEALPAGGNNFARYPESVVPVPDGVAEIFPNGTYNSFIANVTARPSFVSAAEAVQEFWRLQFDTKVDGILSLDPVALSYVLRATGPLTLSTGDALSSDNVVSLLLNEVYLRYDSGNYARDNAAQDVVYAEAVDTMFTAVSGGKFDPAELVNALAQGWDESRILYWSAHEDEQSQLEAIGLNGEIPVSDDTAERYGVYFHDNVGSKLGYYLNQSVTVASGNCKAEGGQIHRVSVDITNTINPADVKDLPLSILGTYQLEKLKPAVQRMFVMLYTPPGSIISGATVGGLAVALEDLHDSDYPVGKLTILVAPGETVSLSYDVTAGSAAAADVEVQTTPMVNPTTIAKEELDCSTVAAG